MCSIIGSFSKDKLKELIKLNQHRGNFSYSITNIDSGFQMKAFGEFEDKYLDIVNSGYIISHLQAPTGGLIEDIERVHPTIIGETQLWHNGLLTSRGVKVLQNKLDTYETFDTKLLHLALDKFGFDILSEIEGLFSCLYIKNGFVYLFRTKHGKLYIDEEMSISSERFENSKCINADTIYEIDLNNKIILKIDEFKTLRFNYIIQGEF